MSENFEKPKEGERGGEDLEAAKRLAAQYFTKHMLECLEFRDVLPEIDKISNRAPGENEEEIDGEYLVWSIYRDNVNNGNLFGPMTTSRKNLDNIETVDPGHTGNKILLAGGSVADYFLTQEASLALETEADMKEWHKEVAEVLAAIEKLRK